MTKPRKARIFRWLLVAGVPLVLAGVALSFFLMHSGPADTGPTLFIIQRSKNANEVQVEADGKEAYLTRLFIQVDESGLTPSALYVDLFGEEVDGGDPVKEHLVKD